MALQSVVAKVCFIIFLLECVPAAAQVYPMLSFRFLDLLRDEKFMLRGPFVTQHLKMRCNSGR